MGTKLKVALPGTGTMGRGMAQNLLKAGYPLTVYNRTRAKAEPLAQGAAIAEPRVFSVNWFRKDADGKYLWPGFSENMRILKWIVDRVRGRALGKETRIGWQPYYDDITWAGLDLPRETFEELERVDSSLWREEVMAHEDMFINVHSHLPPEMVCERELLICRL